MPTTPHPSPLLPYSRSSFRGYRSPLRPARSPLPCPLRSGPSLSLTANGGDPCSPPTSGFSRTPPLKRTRRKLPIPYIGTADERGVRATEGKATSWLAKEGGVCSSARRRCGGPRARGSRSVQGAPAVDCGQQPQLRSPPSKFFTVPGVVPTSGSGRRWQICFSAPIFASTSPIPQFLR